MCLRLENTDFIKGLDMTAYWDLQLPCREIPVSEVDYREDSDLKKYVAERWPDEVEYAKAWLYGRIAAYAAESGCLGDTHEFGYFENNPGVLCDALSFLYSDRMLHRDGQVQLNTFPPRYQQVEKLLERPVSWRLTKKQKQDVIDTIVSAFNGERPKMLPEVRALKQPHHDYLSLLSEIEYISILCDPFDESSIEWLVKLVNNASNLQVVVLQGCNVIMKKNYYCLDLDAFCERLPTCREFWSRFRILKVVPGIFDDLQKDFGVDTPKKYTVSRASLNQLITAYLSAPTNHSQLVQFSFTDIVVITEESQDADSDTITVSQDTNLDFDTIDQTCVQFKNIRLSDCDFDSNKATPDTISKWLGHQIKNLILEEEEETSSILFQIDHKDSCSVLGHKRKHCEVAEVDSDPIN